MFIKDDLLDLLALNKRLKATKFPPSVKDKLFGHQHKAMCQRLMVRLND